MSRVTYQEQKRMISELPNYEENTLEHHAEVSFFSSAIHRMEKRSSM